LATLDAFGGLNPDLSASIVEQLVQSVLGFAGVALIPVLTATAVDAVVKSRLDLRDGKLVRRASGHVVVAGLGGVGSHVLRLLSERGVDVIAIDSSPHAVGVQLARDLRIPVIIGDASRPETLVAASVPTCRTLMATTSDDGMNLETALVARSLARDLPVVLRLFDAEFADRIQKAFNINVSRSVSYLAAPSFAARMLGQDLDTIAVGRHVLLMAYLKVAAHSTLEGQTVSDLRRPNRSWIVELTNTQGQRLAGVAASHRRLQRGDRLLVVATRRGLGQLIAEAQPLPDTVPRRIVLHDSSPFDQGPPQPRRP
jgi:Trk K+ transport system NAD-binding subunit